MIPINAMILFHILLLCILYTPQLINSLGLLSFNVSSDHNDLPQNNISYNPARWGTMPPAGINSYELVLASGPLCAPPPSTVDWRGKAVLVMRGECAFSTKALNAQSAGAVLFVIYNCQSTVCVTSPLPYGLDDFVPQAAAFSAPTITSIYITYAMGNPLAQSMVNGSTITLTIQGSGPINTNDLTALKTFYSYALSTSNNKQWVSGAPNGDAANTVNAAGLLQWSNLLTSGFDPCLNRIWGLWCVDGRITTIDCEFCGASGEISSAFYQLNKLHFVSFRDNALNGSFPDTSGTNTVGFGNLQLLNQLYLDGNTITSIPPSFGDIPNLFNPSNDDELMTPVKLLLAKLKYVAFLNRCNVGS